VDWNEDVQKRNQPLLDKMTTLLGKFKVDIDKTLNARAQYEVSRNQQELNKADYNIDRIKIFVAVLNRLIESEKNKVMEIKGGSRKFRKSKRRHTRKHRY